MYVKRQTVEKSWPIARKGTKYIVVASHEKKQGVPVLIILRDMLKVARNRREVKKILSSGSILVDDKIIKKENFSVVPFSVIKIGNKNYEFVFSNKGKFMIQEGGKRERVFRVIGKKCLKNKKIQLNLMYGKNIILKEKEKVGVGDSIVIQDKKIAKVLPLEKNREVIVFSGKYKGKEGKIEKIEGKIVTLSGKDKKLNVPIKSIIVVK